MYLFPFAQTEAATPTTIVGAFIFVALALMSLIGWLMRHIFLTTIPAIHAEQAAERKAHEESEARQRKEHTDDLEAERALRDKQFGVVNAAIVALTSVVDKGREATVSEMKRHITEAMAQYRHDLYDKLNQAVLGRDLYLLQKQQQQEADEEDGPQRPRP